MAGYRDLRVWQEARRLVSEVYHITYQLPPAEIYALSDQMRRAVVSIGSNIAEGQGRGTSKDSAHFLYIARGSAYELDTQLCYCMDLGFGDKSLVSAALNRVGLIISLLNQMLSQMNYSRSSMQMREETNLYDAKEIDE